MCVRVDHVFSTEAILVMIKLFGEATGVVNGIIAERVVKCYAFAPPPVFGPLNKIPRWANATTHTFVHYVDMVPRSQVIFGFSLRFFSPFPLSFTSSLIFSPSIALCKTCDTPMHSGPDPLSLMLRE